MIHVPNRKYVFILLLLTVLSACSGKRDAYFQFKGIENAHWNKNTVYNFVVNMTDTVNTYNIFLEVRNKESYPFRNLWLFVDLRTPEGKLRKDTVNCELADAMGQWHGKGSNLHTLSFPFDQGFRFRIPGTYVYSVKQGMREDELKGISDIGLRVVKQSDH
ncbi:MAG: gliding motility lipoprotein GldH [Dysgonamonadaceae bacterium]|jgi:gliding motility-associated lipoprotein GldH|nr:gliding motility lipoprotein GldH [Dysgonamonadaceae bacterium]